MPLWPSTVTTFSTIAGNATDPATRPVSIQKIPNHLIPRIFHLRIIDPIRRILKPRSLPHRSSARLEPPRLRLLRPLAIGCWLLAIGYLLLATSRLLVPCSLGPLVPAFLFPVHCSLLPVFLTLGMEVRIPYGKRYEALP
jgi:hypothetical protein